VARADDYVLRTQEVVRGDAVTDRVIPRRVNSSAFTRRERLATSTPQLDELEELWWDAQSDLVECLWGLPEEVRSVLRRDFARRARTFFTGSRIVEIACGSGWPGRMIAGTGIRIVGYDLSAQQVKLAQEKAAKEGLATECEYHHGDITAIAIEDFDGAFIHAGLHHLADDEVEALLDRLARGGPAFKVLLYEPVYPRPLNLPAALRSVLVHAIRLMVRIVTPPERKFSYDKETVKRLDEAVRASSDQGWFFSPKEAPFEKTRLVAELVKRFRIVRVYPCHFRSIDVAQKVALIIGKADRDRALARYLEPALRLDKLLFATGLHRLFADRYVFYGFELVGGAAENSE
jgi:2-polyprenyl-3-methyl-5-hydroxy-6-metoxy-1,4-benzoquinol methylase